MSNLYYRFEGYARDVMEEYLRRVFKYSGPWANSGLELVQVDDITAESVYQTFFEDPETYPLITISTTNGQNVKMGFNDQIANLYDIDVPMGTRSLQLVDFSGNSPLAFKLPDYTGSISGISCDMLQKVPYPVDDIAIKLYQNYFSPTGSIHLASGSIRSFDYDHIATFFGELWPHTILQPNNDYWVEFSPISGSVYRMCVDSSYNGVYSSISYSGSVPSGSMASGSLYGGMRISPVFRMGGAHEFTLSVKCSAKNSIEKAQNLADLTEIYVKLGQYANINRLNTNVGKLDLAQLSPNDVSFLTNKGISIKSVNKGTIENRRRGDNDVIFTISVSIDMRTEWNMDFDENHLFGINTTLDGY